MSKVTGNIEQGAVGPAQKVNSELIPRRSEVSEDWRRWKITLP